MKKYKPYLLLVLLVLIIVNLYLAYYDKFNILIPIACGITLYIIYKVILLIIPVSENSKINYLLLIASIVFALSLGEALLRIHGKYNTHYEKKGGEWRSNFKSPNKERGHLHLWPPNTPVVDTSISEFRYTFHSNSLGLIGPEPEKKKKEKSYRILGLGDSFMQGVGTSADSAWLKLMENKLNLDTTIQPVQTLNAGVSGSDVYYEYQLLKKLENYEVDLVIIAINRSDMEDFYIRRGWERFKENGTTVFKSPPWYEQLHRISHLVRLVVHRILKKDIWFRSPGEEQAFESTFLLMLEDVIGKTKTLCKERQVDLMVLFHPTLVDYNNKETPYSPLVEKLSEQEIKAIDLYLPFVENGWITPENYWAYFWKNDGHYNSKGYQYMGDYIANEILKLNLVPEKINDSSGE